MASRRLIAGDGSRKETGLVRRHLWWLAVLVLVVGVGSARALRARINQRSSDLVVGVERASGGAGSPSASLEALSSPSLLARLLDACTTKPDLRFDFGHGANAGGICPGRYRLVVGLDGQQFTFVIRLRSQRVCTIYVVPETGAPSVPGSSCEIE